ncbi:MAG: putative zinc-binding metallopeptidase [Hoeflea sp.]|uniref:zinc-binding metallopeptidase family protein n=1 Tax=Hoeflea sp. TaxID=1940281 RepID=UPI0032970629|tara:strand:+ start:12334 stop:13392 length:1059 start_codon:yes stop_codon:yes gene_type:complete
MRRYACPNCSNEVHFRNSECVNCQSRLGYVPAWDQMFYSRPDETQWHDGATVYKACANRQEIFCNWLVEDGVEDEHCLSCRHTLVIPDLSANENRDHWAALEEAKRRLFYSIEKFGLGVGDLEHTPEAALRFHFKADTLSADGKAKRVLTGHENGLITINVAEADDPTREKYRKAMGEPYRTLIGHFRHEVGHYYWDQLVANGPKLEAYRAIFGDEREDYGEALKRHYETGAPAGWEASFVSSYACAHSWEDFAETWAHYFHIVDGLETAGWYGLDGHTPDSGLNRAPGGWSDAGPYGAADFRPLMDAWVPLTVAMNAMNRSIGLGDFYPFVLSDTIFSKLEFIHDLIHRRG